MNICIKNQRASILLLALWTLLLLSFFAVVLGSGVRQKLELVKRLDERDSLQAATSSVVQNARMRVKGERNKLYQTLNDGWNHDPSAFQEVVVGKSVVSAPHYVAVGKDIVTFYGLTDEESKININKAPAKILIRLFKIFGLEDLQAQNLAYSIIDWRDADELLSVPVGSAESSYYRNLPVPYEAQNSDFEVIDEVLLVKGMDEALFKKIRNYITVYGSGVVNINTASKPVLSALGLSVDMVNLIVGYLYGKDGIPGTGDDAWFISAGGITGNLSAAYHLSDSELMELSNCVSDNLVDVRSTCFTVSTRAAMIHGRATQETTAVIDTQGAILYIQES